MINPLPIYCCMLVWGALLVTRFALGDNSRDNHTDNKYIAEYLSVINKVCYI